MNMTSAPLRDVFEWDIRTWSRALPLWHAHLTESRPASVLTVGERGGGLSLWFAGQGFDVVCSGMHPFRQSTIDLHRQYGVDSRIDYRREDVTALTAADASFEIVALKSVIGALGSKEAQVKGLHEIHRVLKSGGRFFFAENLRATWLHEWCREHFVPWSHDWRYLDFESDRDLFAPFSDLDDRTTGFLSVFGRSEWQRDLLARIDGFLSKVVPRTWNTVWYGVAVK